MDYSGDRMSEREYMERYWKHSLLYGYSVSTAFGLNLDAEMIKGFMDFGLDRWVSFDPEYYRKHDPVHKYLQEKYTDIQRRIAIAGWEPVTRARTDVESVQVERFGPGADGAVYFSVLNHSPIEQKGQLVIHAEALSQRAIRAIRNELQSGEEYNLQETPDNAGVITFPIASEEIKVFKCLY
jgi:hypothetical protein